MNSGDIAIKRCARSLPHWAWASGTAHNVWSADRPNSSPAHTAWSSAGARP